MVRTHALALERGVERFFCYNYRDRGPSTTDVEEHFELVDHWGFPKRVYPANVTTHRCLAGKSFKTRRDLTGTCASMSSVTTRRVA